MSELQRGDRFRIRADESKRFGLNLHGYGTVMSTPRYNIVSVRLDDGPEAHLDRDYLEIVSDVLLPKVIKLVQEYQWDSGDEAEEAKIIAEKIIALCRGETR